VLNDLQHMPSSVKKHRKNTEPESCQTTKMFSFYLSYSSLDRLVKNCVTLSRFLHEAAAFLARNNWICYKGWAGKITWTGDKCYTQQKGIVLLQDPYCCVNCITHKLSKFPSYVATSIVAVLQPQGMHYSVISW